MAHYIDGTEAQVGDVVRGRGYNIRNDHGDLKEIIGIVTYVNVNAQSCNVTLLVPEGILGTFATQAPDWHQGALMIGKQEYGQTDHFEKITAEEVTDEVPQETSGN